MANVERIKVVYVDGEEVCEVLVTLGDTVRAQDWAEKEYKDASQRRKDERAGFYAVYLAAKRQHLKDTGLDWLEWLDRVTIEDDGEEHTETEPGESDGPQSAS